MSWQPYKNFQAKAGLFFGPMLDDFSLEINADLMQEILLNGSGAAPSVTHKSTKSWNG